MLPLWYVLGVILYVLVGYSLAKMSLLVLRYPKRYPVLLRLVLFPMTIAADWQGRDSDPSKIFLDYCGEGDFTALMGIAEVREWHLDNDEDASRRARMRYVVATIILLPLRLAWIAVFGTCCAITVGACVLFEMFLLPVFGRFAKSRITDL